MKSYFKPFVFGLLIWLVAISFFIIFGKDVLVGPSHEQFFKNMSLLIIGTIVALSGAFFIYERLDLTKQASIKLGIIGTSSGLLLDSICLIFHKDIFQQLHIEQVVSFTIWMAIAYAFYLLIPLYLYVKRTKIRIMSIEK